MLTLKNKLKIIAYVVSFSFNALGIESTYSELPEEILVEQTNYNTNTNAPLSVLQNHHHSHKELQKRAKEVMENLDHCTPQAVEKGRHLFSFVKNYGIDPNQLTWDFYHSECKALLRNCTSLVTSLDPLFSDINALSSTISACVPSLYSPTNPNSTRELYDSVYAAALSIEHYIKSTSKPRLIANEAREEFSTEFSLNLPQIILEEETVMQEDSDNTQEHLSAETSTITPEAICNN